MSRTELLIYNVRSGRHMCREAATVRGTDSFSEHLTRKFSDPIADGEIIDPAGMLFPNRGFVVSTAITADDDARELFVRLINDRNF